VRRRCAVTPRGFTLIEVLVALAIVAIGMAAVLGTLTSSASTVLYLRDKTIAQWVALNHIAEQRLQNTPGQVPQTGNSDGDVDYAGSKWHWRQEIVATSVQGMVRLDVMVRPADVKADDTHGWYVTLSGIIGDAVGAPRGDLPLWGSGTTTPTPGQPGTSPGTSPLPGAANTGGLGGSGTQAPATSPQTPITPPR
jgi:general secretion pathway protein I